jgi:hypothetical protein
MGRDYKSDAYVLLTTQQGREIDVEKPARSGEYLNQ